MPFTPKTIKVKWFGISLVRTFHGRLDIRNFSSRVEYFSTLLPVYHLYPWVGRADIVKFLFDAISSISYACGYNAVNYELWRKISHHAQNHVRKLTIFLLLPRPFLSSLSPSPSGTLWMDSFQTSARLFMQDGGLSARGSPQNRPALHAKTQGATRVQQFAC